MTSATSPRLAFADSVAIVSALALSALPHATRMPLWVSLLAGTLMAWHLYLARMRLAAPGRWAMAIIVLGAAAAVYLEFRTLFGRDPGIALLVIMLSLKLLEMKSAREATLLLALAFFLVLTHFLFSQTILTAAYLLACVWLVTAAMTRLQQRPGASSGRLALRTAGVLLVQSVPLMIALFVLFPRVQGPLWGMPKDAHTGLTGLSDTMTPGTMSNLILSDDIAFRVQFGERMPKPEMMYWRGPVLSHFDGRTWTAGWTRENAAPRFQAENDPLRYEVTLEAHNKRWLFALDLPGRVPPNASASSEFVLLARTPVTSRMRYDMTSFLDYHMGVEEAQFMLRRALQLPRGTNPRTLEYGRELRARYADDKALILAVLDRFRNERYEYTLTPPLLHEYPVDEFLFDTKQGFCEHYSSAFAVLMRAAGIPARIVTGYQGGELNPVGGYFIVRQADAHAWTEVWLQGEGWVRIDPTAAVSPARVQRGIAAAAGAGSPLPLLVRTDIEFLRRLHLGWDTLAYHWNQWVLGYNTERQRDVASRLGLGDSWQALALALVGVAATLTVVLALTMLRGRRPVRDPADRAYARFCALLGKHGLARAPHEGPGAYGARVAAARPGLASDASAFVTLYGALKYGPPSERVRTRSVMQRLEDSLARVKRGLAR